MALLERTRAPVAMLATSLLISATLLLGGLIAYHANTHTANSNITPWQIKNVTVGRPVRTDLRAEKYAFLNYSAIDTPVAVPLILLWRTLEAPAILHQRLLPRSPRGNSTVALWTDKNWQGTIGRIVIVADADALKGRTAGAVDIKLSAYSSTQLVQALWTEWASPVERNHTTINFVNAIPQKPLLYPLPAVATWLTTSLFIYLLITLTRNIKPQPMAIAIVFILGWLVLDVRWQSLLWYQLVDTEEQYAGKSYQEKLISHADARLIAYTRRIQEDFLPAQPARIFILKKYLEGHDHLRLRMQYFLLPHNSYNFRSELHKDSLQAGDFILIIGNLRDIRYSYATQELNWHNGQDTVNAKRLDKDTFATLYKVLPTTTGTSP